MNFQIGKYRKERIVDAYFSLSMAIMYVFRVFGCISFNIFRHIMYNYLSTRCIGHQFKDFVCSGEFFFA